MTYKQIEASREVRLWIGQVIVPAVTTAVTMGTGIILTNPEIKRSAIEKFDNVKKSVKNKFRKD